MNLWEVLGEVTKPLQAVEDLAAALLHPNPKEALDSYFREFTKYFQWGAKPEPLTDLVRTAEAWGLPGWVGLAASVFAPGPGEFRTLGKVLLNARKLSLALPEGLEVPLITTRGFRVNGHDIPNIPDLPEVDFAVNPPEWAIAGSRKIFGGEGTVNFFKHGLGLRAVVRDRYYPRTVGVVAADGQWYTYKPEERLMFGPMTLWKPTAGDPTPAVFAAFARSNERHHNRLWSYYKELTDEDDYEAAAELLGAGVVWDLPKPFFRDPTEIAQDTLKKLGQINGGARMFIHYTAAAWQGGQFAGNVRNLAVALADTYRHDAGVFAEALAQLPDSYKVALRLLSEAAVKPKRPITAIRWTEWPKVPLEVGNVYTDLAPMALSRDPNWEWFGNLKLEVTINPDTPVVDIAHLGGIPYLADQQEIVLLPGTALRIDEVRPVSSDITLVRATALPPRKSWPGGYIVSIGGLLMGTSYLGMGWEDE